MLSHLQYQNYKPPALIRKCFTPMITKRKCKKHYAHKTKTIPKSKSNCKGISQLLI